MKLGVITQASSFQSYFQFLNPSSAMTQVSVIF